jgi:uncharacterized protein with GYD domain
MNLMRNTMQNVNIFLKISNVFGDDRMIFITLARWKKKPTKESLAESAKLFEKLEKEGAKILGMYWTLGRYDAVVITEGKDEKAAMQSLVRWGDLVSTETLVAVKDEEAHKLIE